MSFSKSNKRFCQSCRIVKTQCVCEYFQIHENQTKLWLFQDPREKKKKNSTAYWSTKFLKKVAFEDENLVELGIQLNSTAQVAGKTNLGVLCPNANSVELTKESWDSRQHLVVLDGTWSHVLKMQMELDCLQNVQFYHISGLESHFPIRKPPYPNAVSTLEAVSCFYEMIEDNSKMAQQVQKLLLSRTISWQSAKSQNTQ